MPNTKRSAAELTTEFRLAYDAELPRILRSVRNTLSLSGVSSTHWTNEERAALIKGGFDINGNYSVVGKFVRGLGGNFLDNSFNPHFVSNDNADLDSDLAHLLNKVYITEKNLRRYKKSNHQALYDGLVCLGIEEILIDRPKMSDPRTWGISFDTIRPDQIIFNPGEKNKDIALESTKCWTFGYYSLEDIKNKYPKKKDALSILAQSISPTAYELNTADKAPHDIYQHNRNNQFQIVTAYELKSETVKVEMYIGDGELEAIPMFEEYKKNSDEWNQARNLWALERDYDISDEDNIINIDEEEMVLYLSVWLPAFNLMLDQGKDERQLGRLPFFTWSYQTDLGVSSGLVDLLWSTYHDIQVREAAKTKFITSTPLQKPYVQSELFDGDQKELTKFVNDWSDGSKPLILNSEVPPSMAGKYMGITPGGVLPAIVTSDESFKMNLLTEISGQSPASFGRTERSGESGVQLKQKIVESGAVQRFPIEGREEYDLQKSRAWLELAPQVFAGTANLNRSFGDAVANDLQGFDEDGDMMMLNDLSNLSAINVDITKDTNTESFKQYQAQQAMSYLQTVQPSPSNAEAISSMNQQLLMSRNFLSVEDEERTKEIIKRMREAEELNAIANTEEAKARMANARAAIAQAEMTIAQTEQAKQPQELSQGAPQEGEVPQEGTEQPTEENVPPEQAQ